MKKPQKSSVFVVLLFVFVISSCSDNKALKARIDQQQATIDSLKNEVGLLKPGLGEYMSQVQQHHAKLWFAGINDNWKLADFEIGEIKETIEAAKQVDIDRPELKSISMLYPPLDSVANAVANHDHDLFKKSFISLTNTCNSCHRLNKFEFNVITIPTQPPVPNQSFQ